MYCAYGIFHKHSTTLRTESTLRNFTWFHFMGQLYHFGGSFQSSSHGYFIAASDFPRNFFRILTSVLEHCVHGIRIGEFASLPWDMLSVLRGLGRRRWWWESTIRLWRRSELDDLWGFWPPIKEAPLFNIAFAATDRSVWNWWINRQTFLLFTKWDLCLQLQHAICKVNSKGKHQQGTSYLLSQALLSGFF